MDQPITFLLNEVVWLMNRHADILLKKNYDISFSWFQLLSVLRTIEPTTQHGLARCIGHSDAAISRMLTLMEKADYVQIQIDPEHGRRHVVQLTDRASDVISRATVELEEAFQKLLDDSQIDIASYGAMNVIIKQCLMEERP